MVPFPGGRVSPGQFIPGGAGVIQVLIDNSSVPGIFRFGGCSNVLGTQAPGHLAAFKREVGGDFNVFDDLWKGAPIQPPFYIWFMNDVSGDLMDSGGAGFVTNFVGCISITNSGAWSTAAGIARTVQRTFDVTIRDSSSLIEPACNGTGDVFSRVYTIQAIFSG